MGRRKAAVLVAFLGFALTTSAITQDPRANQKAPIAPVLEITAHRDDEITGVLRSATLRVSFSSRMQDRSHAVLQVKLGDIMLGAEADLGEDTRTLDGHGHELSLDEHLALAELNTALEQHLDPYKRELAPHADLLHRVVSYWAEAPVGYEFKRRVITRTAPNIPPLQPDAVAATCTYGCESIPSCFLDDSCCESCGWPCGCNGNSLAHLQQGCSCAYYWLSYDYLGEYCYCSEVFVAGCDLDSACLGRCGSGCGGADGAGVYSYDCADHDRCGRGHGDCYSSSDVGCLDEFDEAADDYLLLSYNCGGCGCGPADCGDGTCDSVCENSSNCCQDCAQCCNNSDCGSCQYCDNGICRDYECCSNSDCGSCETCNTSTHRCQNVSCAGCNVCNNDHGCTNYACCSNSDCGSCQTCNTSTHTCQNVSCAGCNVCNNNHGCTNYECCGNGDCEPCEKCENHSCVNVNCPTDQVCDGDHGCVPDTECTLDSECGSCQTCNTSTHTCQNVSCGGCNVCNNNHGCTNYACCSNSDCGSCQTCNTSTHTCQNVSCGGCNVCNNNHGCTNYACCDNEDCGPCQMCNTSTHTCENVNCPTDQVCDGDHGCAPDTDCNLDSECGLCQTCNTSTHTCESVNCPVGQVCNNDHGCAPDGEQHPADEQPYCACATCGDNRIEMCEAIGYASAWKQGDHDDMAKAMLGLFIWQSGECYTWDDATSNWIAENCN